MNQADADAGPTTDLSAVIFRSRLLDSRKAASMGKERQVSGLSQRIKTR